VLDSANVSPEDLRSIADEVRAIVRSSNLSTTDLLLAGRELAGMLRAG
jgi:hypothetical protein